MLPLLPVQGPHFEKHRFKWKQKALTHYSSTFMIRWQPTSAFSSMNRLHSWQFLLGLPCVFLPLQSTHPVSLPWMPITLHTPPYPPSFSAQSHTEPSHTAPIPCYRKLFLASLSRTCLFLLCSWNSLWVPFSWCLSMSVSVPVPIHTLHTERGLIWRQDSTVV